MSNQKTAKPTIPAWAWLFGAICLSIPVLTVGGAVPTAIGFGGAFYCIAVSRNRNTTTGRRLLHCAAAAAVCWTLFVAFLGGLAVLGERFPALTNSKCPIPITNTQRANLSDIAHDVRRDVAGALSDESVRRKIYAMAVRMRKHLEWAKAQREDRLAKGLDVKVLDRQIEHLNRMHEKQLEFTAQFFKITRKQLDEIITEGDRERWPPE